eukprot:4628853-Pleurochrysis_carterae.AAC.1
MLGCERGRGCEEDKRKKMGAYEREGEGAWAKQIEDAAHVICVRRTEPCLSACIESWPHAIAQAA